MPSWISLVSLVKFGRQPKVVRTFHSRALPPVSNTLLKSTKRKVKFSVLFDGLLLQLLEAEHHVDSLALCLNLDWAIRIFSAYFIRWF